MSLALTGQRVALFNTNVLSCNSNYLGPIWTMIHFRKNQTD
ncbi:hypothetical protein DDI_2776 [Dickeya dianthicola RNS04.9]|nr:hypothetical protein DDI_2776 [Dickeya dianthicola RNS04.9]